MFLFSLGSTYSMELKKLSTLSYVLLSEIELFVRIDLKKKVKMIKPIRIIARTIVPFLSLLVYVKNCFTLFFIIFLRIVNFCKVYHSYIETSNFLNPGELRRKELLNQQYLEKPYQESSCRKNPSQHLN